MASLIKRRFTARKHEEQHSQRHVYFQFAPDEDENREGIYLTRKHWDLMGQPEVITVAVEPGDTLADEENEQNLLDKIPSRLPDVPLTFRS